MRFLFLTIKKIFFLYDKKPECIEKFFFFLSKTKVFMGFYVVNLQHYKKNAQINFLTLIYLLKKKYKGLNYN